MLNFVYDNKTEIIFGKDTLEEVGKLTKRFGKKVLLHYGSGSIKKYGVYDKIVSNLKDNGIDYIELGGVVPNPKLGLVKEGIELCRKEKVDFILAVGGGSVIDSAKAIALGFYYDGDVWDFYSKGLVPEKVLPVGVVLTIPAAGSENSTATVITNEDGDFKRGYGDISLRPKFSILNPELTFTLPNYQSACGAVDIIGHVIERYFTNTTNIELTDRLSESVMRTVINNTPKVLKDNNNYAARAEIMWSGSLAHNGLVGTGREEDWASHGLEMEISAIYDLAHGAGLAIIYPAWMKYVYKHDLNRFALFANKVFDIEINKNNLEETALKGIEALENFYKAINMPVRLSDAEIDDTHFEEMANKLSSSGTEEIGAFVKLNKEDMLTIYKLAL
jgi:alcohol dehydrogenase YqhD (iron-dependent ADH family)